MQSRNFRNSSRNDSPNVGRGNGETNLTKLSRAASLLSLVAALAPGLVHAQVDPTRTVVVVNGEEVKGAEYYRRMEYLDGVGKKVGATIAEFPPGFLTIEQLITERLVFQLAKDRGVLPSDLEVTNELADRIKANPTYLADLKTTGRTEDDLRYRIRYELAQFKLATFGVTVTDQEIEKYYKDNPTLFTTPTRYKLSVILVTQDSAKADVDADLAASKPFGDVAKARSEDLTKANNGEYGTIPITLFNPATRSALESVKIGGVTNWLNTTANDAAAYIKFKVDDILPSQLDPLTPELKRDIRRKRMIELGSVKNNLESDMIDMRKKAKVDIRQKEFADAYAKYIQAYLNQNRAKGG